MTTMDRFKSQMVHVVNTVDNLNIKERIEALSYLQKITEAYKNKSLSNLKLTSSTDLDLVATAPSNKFKHKCKAHLCLINNIRHLKKITCFKCDKRLETEFQLFEHSQTHLDYPVSCVHCRCTFRNSEDYSSHKVSDCTSNRERSHNATKYVCKVCQSSFSNKKTFQSHLLDNHGMKLYNNWYGCKLCHEMFEQKKLLYHHYKNVHSEIKCRLEISDGQCDTVTTSSCDLDNSSQCTNRLSNENNETLSNSDENEEAEKFQCVHCGRIFKKKFMLSVHIKRHLREKEFSCNLCKKTFTAYRYYKKHLQSISHQNKDVREDRPIFKCNVCEKIFANRDSWSRHQVRVHNTTDKRLKCPLCDFKTSLNTSLNRHINLHTDNRKFICDQCGSCFHTLSALKDHTVYVHSTERNYSCEICGQQFKQKSGLNRHFKTHSSEKEFKCFCGQVYKFRTNLRRHLLTAHKISGKKSSVTRVTTEEEGYALNSPKTVQRKTKQTKKETSEARGGIDDFDIPSLSALSDVDLSCADEVLRETYDTFSKYSSEHVDSQESLNSILAPAQLIDHVLQENTNVTALTPMERKEPVMNVKQACTSSSYTMMDVEPSQYTESSIAPMSVTALTPLHSKPSAMNVKGEQTPSSYTMMAVEPSQYTENNIPPMNYRAATCRQYLTSSFVGDMLSDDQHAAQMASKMDGQYLHSTFDGASQMMENTFGKQYSSNQFLLEMQVEDESSFPYYKWLNEIYESR